MRKLIVSVIFVALFVALFFAVKESFAPETWNNFVMFMFGDYAELYNVHIADNLPSITHPVVLIVLAIFAFALITARAKK